MYDIIEYDKIEYESLGRISTISLIMLKLLSNNYDCTKLLINKLKEIELSEARDYHMKQFKIKPIYFSTYSFYCILKGCPYRKEQLQKAYNTLIREGRYYHIIRRYSSINKYNKLLRYSNFN